MDNDQDEPSQPDGRLGSLFGIGIDAGFPPIIRVWHRLMMATVVVFAVLAAGTLFGIFPDSWHRLFGIFGLATMLLLVLGWAYRARLRPEFGCRRLFGLSRQRAFVVNTAAAVTAVCVGVMQTVDGNRAATVAVAAIASLIICAAALITRPRKTPLGDLGDDATSENDRHEH